MKTFFFLIQLFACHIIAQAQDAYISAQVSRDQFNPQDVIVVTYTLHNADLEQWQEPNFSPLQKLNHAQTSNSVSIINGKKTSKTSYTYRLKASSEGNFVLPAASAQTSAGNLQSNAIDISVSSEYEPMPEPKNSFGGGLGGFDNFNGFDSPFGDVNQFFNNPNLFKFEMPQIEGFDNPMDFNNLWPEFDKMFDQQFKTAPKNNNPKLPPGVEPKPNPDPKKEPKIYKL